MKCLVNILMLMLIEDIKRLWLGCNSHDILAHFANRYIIAFTISPSQAPIFTSTGSIIKW